jgi:hypothetical protein
MSAKQLRGEVSTPRVNASRHASRHTQDATRVGAHYPSSGRRVQHHGVTTQCRS